MEGNKEETDVSDVVLTFTVFHTLAAIAIFALMIVGVVGAVQNKRQSQD